MSKRFFNLTALTAAFLAAACTETGPEKPVVTPQNSNGGGCLDTLYSCLEQPGDGTRVKFSWDFVFDNPETFELTQVEDITQNKVPLLPTTIYCRRLIQFPESTINQLYFSGGDVYVHKSITCSDELYIPILERQLQC